MIIPSFTVSQENLEDLKLEVDDEGDIRIFSDDTNGVCIHPKNVDDVIKVLTMLKDHTTP